MASAPAPVFTTPMSSGEEAIKVFQSGLCTSIVQTLVQSKLTWNSLKIAHRGRDPRHLDQCPPTVIITTDATSLQQVAWKNVETQIRASIAKATNIRIEVEILPGIPISFKAIDVHLPYPLPRTVGYSFGPEEEEPNEFSKPYTGTLGGYLRLPEEANEKVVLTCNHVANPRDLVPEGQAPEKVVNHVMRSPSNQDHNETIRAAEAAFFRLDDPHLLNLPEKRAFVDLAKRSWQHYPTPTTDNIKFPRGSSKTVGQSWAVFVDNAVSENWVRSMNGIPTAAELGDQSMNACPFRTTLHDLRTRFDHIWTAEMRDSSSEPYRRCRNASRNVGQTKHASGLRVWPTGDTANVSVVDWGLVGVVDDGVSHNPANVVPQELRELANQIEPGCALATAAFITQIGGGLHADDIVFKIGRTTGVNGGKVDASKVILTTEALVSTGILPADGKLGDRVITSAKEWNVAGMKQWDDTGIWLPTDQFARPGDSGAWIVNANAELVGMVYCGMENQGQTYVQDIQMILQSISQVAHVNIALP